MAIYQSIYEGPEVDAGVGRSYVPTLNAAPTASTLTFTLGGNTVDFAVGQMARVADQSEATGYKFYQLYDITGSDNNKEAHWQAVGSGQSVLGTIIANLETYVNDAKTSGADLVGVQVTLTNTTDSTVVGTVTLTSGETQAVFRNVTPMKSYSISVSAVSGYTQPQAQTIAELGFYAEVTKTFQYEADEYTVSIVSNQGAGDSAISSATVTIEGTAVSNGGTKKVPKGTSISPTASAVARYSVVVSTSGKIVTATYSTTLVSLNMSALVDGQSTTFPTGASGTVKYSGGTDQVLTDNSSTAKVPTGTAFTIEYAAVEGYTTPDTYSATAAGTSMTATAAVYEEVSGFVDLGLPSGRKWAIGNIISDGNGGYKTGEETDYGAYFSWGNIVPHFSANGSTFDDGYNWGTSNTGAPYANTPGKQVSANIPSNDATHDAALALLGSPWHLPTKEDFKELYDNTDNEWTTINGVTGCKFMKKTNHSIYVFFPAAGIGNSTSLLSRGSLGYYWSSSWYSADNAYFLYFNSSSVNPLNRNYRYYGFSVRAVQ